MTCFLRKRFGRYWRVQLALCLAFMVIGFTIEPGGPTGSMFDLVIVVVFLLITIIIETCGLRADGRADQRKRGR